MDWTVIRQEYESSEITLKDLAAKYGISEGTMRSRKNREKWQRNATTGATQRATETSVATPEVIEKPETFSEVTILDSDLTPMQILFVKEYLVDLNATQAAIRAGYSKKTANEQGARLLAKASVKKLIEQDIAERIRRTEISQDEVVNLLANILRSNITDFAEFGQKEIEVIGAFGPVKDENGEVLKKTINYVDFKPSSVVDGSLIQEVKMGKDGANLKLLDKLKAVELLGRHLGMFIERKEVTGKDGGPIELTAMTAEQREQRIRELLDKRNE